MSSADAADSTKLKEAQINTAWVQLIPESVALRDSLAAKRDGDMDEDDLDLVKPIVDALARIARSEPVRLREHLRLCHSDSVRGFTTRFDVYGDEDLEVRLHIYNRGAKETFIHTHQSSFISVCAQGGYLHKIHSTVAAKGDTIYSFKRERGGVYELKEKRSSERLCTYLAQPFQRGQMLFLSRRSFHSLELLPGSQDPVVTIIFRCKHANPEPTLVLQPSKTLRDEVTSQKTVPISEEERDLTAEQFFAAVAKLRLGDLSAAGDAHLQRMDALLERFDSSTVVLQSLLNEQRVLVDSQRLLLQQHSDFSTAQLLLEAQRFARFESIGFVYAFLKSAHLRKESSVHSRVVIAESDEKDPQPFPSSEEWQTKSEDWQLKTEGSDSAAWDHFRLHIGEDRFVLYGGQQSSAVSLKDFKQNIALSLARAEILRKAGAAQIAIAERGKEVTVLLARLAPLDRRLFSRQNLDGDARLFAGDLKERFAGDYLANTASAKFYLNHCFVSPNGLIRRSPLGLDASPEDSTPIRELKRALDDILHEYNELEYALAEIKEAQIVLAREAWPSSLPSLEEVPSLFRGAFLQRGAALAIFEVLRDKLSATTFQKGELKSKLAQIRGIRGDAELTKFALRSLWSMSTSLELDESALQRLLRSNTDDWALCLPVVLDALEYALSNASVKYLLDHGYVLLFADGVDAGRLINPEHPRSRRDSAILRFRNKSDGKVPALQLGLYFAATPESNPYQSVAVFLGPGSQSSLPRSLYILNRPDKAVTQVSQLVTRESLELMRGAPWGGGSLTITSLRHGTRKEYLAVVPETRVVAGEPISVLYRGENSQSLKAASQSFMPW